MSRTAALALALFILVVAVDVAALLTDAVRWWKGVPTYTSLMAQDPLWIAVVVGWQGVGGIALLTHLLTQFVKHHSGATP